MHNRELQERSESQPTPSFSMKINRTTYTFNLFFSNTDRETPHQKLEWLMTREVPCEQVAGVYMSNGLLHVLCSSPQAINKPPASRIGGFRIQEKKEGDVEIGKEREQR